MTTLLADSPVPVPNDCAELVGAPVPLSVRDATRDALARVSAPARRAASIASLLGPTFSFDHVAAMLEVPPASLLGPLEELARAELLVDDGNQLAFTSEDIRHVVMETVPGSARRALQRQAIDVLVQAGASPMEPAVHLATSAHAGDGATISTLLAAARALASSDPGAAAELSRRAFDLTAPGDELRGPLVAETVHLLHAADRAEDGKAFADAALRGRLAPEEEAEILMSIARMDALSPDVCIEAGRTALALSGVSAAVRAEHLSRLVDNVLTAGQFERATALLPETETAVASSGDVTATLALDLAKSRLFYMNGAYRDALQQIDDSVASVRTDAETRMMVAEQWRAELLVATDQFEAAEQAIADGMATARRGRQAWAEKSWERFHGRYLLQAGRIADAATALDGTYIVEDATALTTTADVAALVALGRTAIHTGDARAARALARLAEGALGNGAPEVRRHLAWFLALHAFASGDAAGARARLAELEEDGGVLALPLLMVDLTDPVPLVRLALAAGDDDLALSAVLTAEQRQKFDPETRSIAGSAAHAHGIWTGDLASLAEATACFGDGPRPLARASAHEDYGLALVRDGNRSAGVDELGHALQIYADAGATWDAARVRGRLRELGVRRRLVKPMRPTSGWAGLTDAESAVARLVAEGLKNREVAERLFVSPHTVSMHLRHAFTKLNINSRVELTRLVFVHDQAA